MVICRSCRDAFPERRSRLDQVKVGRQRSAHNGKATWTEGNTNNGDDRSTVDLSSKLRPKILIEILLSMEGLLIVKVPSNQHIQ